MYRFSLLLRAISPRRRWGRGLLALGVLGLVVAGCVRTSLTRLGRTAYPPTVPDSVRIYLEEGDVPGPYEKLALIQASGESNWTTTEQMFDRVREEAATVGANGVLVEGVDEPSAGAKVAGAFLGTGSQRAGRMVAIYVRADTTRTRRDTTAAAPPAYAPRGSNR